MIFGELANFAAYSFAPAILVTPLGALSVLISACLASLFLHEKLGRDGIVGCFLSIIGAIIIILHAPEEKKVDSINEMLGYALQPGMPDGWRGFTVGLMPDSSARSWSSSPPAHLPYSPPPLTHTRNHRRLPHLFTTGRGSFPCAHHLLRTKNWKEEPTRVHNYLLSRGIHHRHGLQGIWDCAETHVSGGSRGFGVSMMITLRSQGINQFRYPSTYVFIAIVIACIMTQMNYFNKALDLFSTNIVTPIYFVFFTTATIIASVILFQGIYDASGSDLASIFCGFITIFIGIFLLNAPKRDAMAAYGSKADGGFVGRDANLLHQFNENNLGFVGLEDDDSNLVLSP